MAINADKTLVTKRIDVGRRLTYTEMDTNFDQLKTVIDDVSTLNDTEVINDGATTTFSTWSSDKINTEIDNLIDDTTTTDVSTWSSNKIESAIVPDWTPIAAATTLSANTYYAVDFTTGPFALTLPATPAVDNFVQIYRSAGSSVDSTIVPNGETIMGLAEDLVIDSDITSLHLVYNGTDWRIV